MNNTTNNDAARDAGQLEVIAPDYRYLRAPSAAPSNENSSNYEIQYVAHLKGMALRKIRTALQNEGKIPDRFLPVSLERGVDGIFRPKINP